MCTVSGANGPVFSLLSSFEHQISHQMATPDLYIIVKHFVQQFALTNYKILNIQIYILLNLFISQFLMKDEI